MKLTELRVNHYEKPMGFAVTPLSFSWKASADSGETMQKWARIVIEKAGKAIYDSGEDAGADSLDQRVPLELEPRTRYDWSLTVCSENDTKGTETSWFETGKMEEQWKARWISTPLDPDIPPVFRKVFTLKEKPESARLYFCGLGLYEVYINGKNAGNEFLAPGYHSYDFHLQAQTYDVTDLLAEGRNTMLILLGDGWFRGRLGFEGGYTNLYGEKNYLIGELYGDGELLLGSDDSWEVRPSPVTFSGIYDGEIFDARLLASLKEENGWQRAVCAVPEKCGKLCDRMSLPIVKKESFSVAEVIHTPKKETVLDFGQEITGWVEFDADIPAGWSVRLTASEIMQEGCFYRENYRTAKSEFTYISDGQKRHIRPHHTFYGFRYMKVEFRDADGKEAEFQDAGGMKAEYRNFGFTAWHLRSDFDSIGSIQTGHTKVNRLIKNAVWGQKDNFLDIPTDCPQRDERLGWTGDAQIFSETACLNMYMPAFYRKYLWDMRAEQSILDGAVPNVVPRLKQGMVGEFGNCPWADAGIVIPWKVYEQYGSKTLLAECYPGMKAWLDYERKHEEEMEGPHLIKDGFHFADWLALDNPQPGPFGATDPLYIASAYYYQNARQVAEAAEILGFTEDSRTYRELEKEILAAIRETYFDPEGLCVCRTQTGAALALMMNLNPDESSAKKQGEVLNKLIKENQDHLNTGFVGTNMLCPALTQAGYNDTAVTLLLNEEYPGWLYCVNLGATTIWERWNSVEADGRLNPEGMNSLNHYSYGSIVGWMYQYLGGIRPLKPGFRAALIAPHGDRRLGSFSASIDTAAGIYKSCWNVNEDGTTTYQVEVPFHAEAEFVVPGHREYLKTGKYVFTI